MGGLKLRVVKSTDGFNWMPMRLDIDAVQKHMSMICENHSQDDEHLLLMTRTAVSEMLGFIKWGDMHTATNRVEQGGLLAGEHYRLDDKNARVCVVTHVFPMFTAKGSSGFLDATADDWKLAYTAMDRHAAESGEHLEAVGWFHTHPNGLATFMSGTDRNTQRNVFNGEFNYALVLNPHTRSWKAFRGPDVADACCIMLDTDDIDALRVSVEPELELNKAQTKGSDAADEVHSLRMIVNGLEERVKRLEDAQQAGRTSKKRRRALRKADKLSRKKDKRKKKH